MGFQFTALQPKIEISGLMGVPAAGQTLVQFLSVNSAVAYTVPAGKTFYLMGITFLFAAGALTCNIKAHGGSPNLVKAGGIDGNTVVVANGSPMVKVVASETLARDNNAATVCVWGFLTTD